MFGFPRIPIWRCVLEEAVEKKLGEKDSLPGVSHWEPKLRREHLQEIIYLHS